MALRAAGTRRGFSLVELVVATSIISIVTFAIMSALGGAWMPLEFTPEGFQLVGHLTPTAWAIDGLRSVIVRGLGLESVLLPAAILLAYAILCLGVAVWRFRSE